MLLGEYNYHIAIPLIFTMIMHWCSHDHAGPLDSTCVHSAPLRRLKMLSNKSEHDNGKRYLVAVIALYTLIRMLW